MSYKHNEEQLDRISNELISWEDSLSIKNDYLSEDEYLFEKENIPMLGSSYSSSSNLTNSSNILDKDYPKYTKINHKHYILYQKRFNRTILCIKYMNVFDKMKLKYIS